MLNSGGEAYWSKKARSLDERKKKNGEVFDEATLKDIQKGMRQWQDQVLGPSPAGGRKESQTASGIPLSPIYTPDDVKDAPFSEMSFPASIPTRGVCIPRCTAGSSGR